MYIGKIFFERGLEYILIKEQAFVKRKNGGQNGRRLQAHLFRKDLQSVHWSTVGLHSWVPTRMLSKEQ